MNLLQIVVKTVITTIDLLIALIVLRTSDDGQGKKIMTMLTIANILGVWI